MVSRKTVEKNDSLTKTELENRMYRSLLKISDLKPLIDSHIASADTSFNSLSTLFQKQFENLIARTIDGFDAILGNSGLQFNLHRIPAKSHPEDYHQVEMLEG
jgi:hypothetical protein